MYILLNENILGGYKWMVCDLSKISHLDLGAVDAIHTASQQCIRKNVCLRIVLPQEDLHKKLIAGGVERETISLTLGSALVQVGKQTVSFYFPIGRVVAQSHG
jgi:hypothetical protein